MRQTCSAFPIVQLIDFDGAIYTFRDSENRIIMYAVMDYVGYFAFHGNRVVLSLFTCGLTARGDNLKQDDC